MTFDFEKLIVEIEALPCLYNYFFLSRSELDELWVHVSPYIEMLLQQRTESATAYYYYSFL